MINTDSLFVQNIYSYLYGSSQFAFNNVNKFICCNTYLCCYIIGQMLTALRSKPEAALQLSNIVKNKLYLYGCSK